MDNSTSGTLKSQLFQFLLLIGVLASVVIVAIMLYIHNNPASTFVCETSQSVQTADLKKVTVTMTVRKVNGVFRATQYTAIESSKVPKVTIQHDYIDERMLASDITTWDDESDSETKLSLNLESAEISTQWTDYKANFFTTQFYFTPTVPLSEVISIEGQFKGYNSETNTLQYDLKPQCLLSPTN
jgi:hypothetical protein